jgi:hypothetical protein
MGETERMRNAVLWDATQRGSCKNLRLGGTLRFHHQSDKYQFI